MNDTVLDTKNGQSTQFFYFHKPAAKPLDLEKIRREIVGELKVTIALMALSNQVAANEKELKRLVHEGLNDDFIRFIMQDCEKKEARLRMEFHALVEKFLKKYRVDTKKDPNVFAVIAAAIERGTSLGDTIASEGATN